MIFDSSDIFRVPWEIVAKAFRNELAKKSFNSLAEYAAEFSSFLEKSPRLFPSEIQKSVFLEGARSAALRLTMRPEVPGESPEARLAATDSMVAARRAGAKPFPPNIDISDADQILALWKDDLVKAFVEWREVFGKSFPTDVASFAELGILEVFKDPGKQLGTTGLVFAGFGDHDIFPAFCEFKSCGIVAGKHVAIEVKQVAITHDTPAWLDSFAQTDMSDTFSMGISRGVYISVMNTIHGGLRSFPTSRPLTQAGHLALSRLSAFLAASFRHDAASPVDEPKPKAAYAPIDCGVFSLAHFKSVLMFGIRASVAARTTYYFPIDHSSRYNRPLGPRPRLPDKRRFWGSCLEAPGRMKWPPS